MTTVWGRFAQTVIFSACAVVPVYAQSPTSTDTQQAAATEVRSAAQLRGLLRSDNLTNSETEIALEEMMQWADVEPDARLWLADLFTNGTPAVPRDLDKAIEILKQGADNGDARALVRIGNIYRDEENGLNVNDALPFYRRAADMGDISSAVRVAEAYRRGTYGVELDPQLAIRYYEAAAATGHVASMMRLGDMYRTGESAGLDVTQAEAWYEKAAAEGIAAAYYRLGDLHRTGALGIPDMQKAVTYYEQAVEGGSPPALIRLASGLLDQSLASGRVSDGIELLQKGVEQDISAARIALARAYLSGRGVERSPGRARELLQAGADGGDVASARYLIRLYTEGRTAGIPKDLDAATALLDTLPTDDGSNLRSFEAVLVATASIGSGIGYEDVAESFRALEPKEQSSVLSRVYLVNRNAYVFLIQERLADDGYFDGTPNGLLTQGTISAINRACTDYGISDVCRLGPLSGRARPAIQDALFAGV